MPSPWTETGQTPQWRDGVPHYEPEPPEGSCQAWADPRGVQMVCRGDRITAALALVDAAIAAYPDDEGTHYEDCHLDHASCLAHRIRPILTGEAADGG